MFVLFASCVMGVKCVVVVCVVLCCVLSIVLRASCLGVGRRVSMWVVVVCVVRGVFLVCVVWCVV